MSRNFLFSLFFLLALLVGASSAWADCSAPVAVEGTMEWDTTEKKFKYCDGTDWNLISPASAGGGGAGVGTIVGFAVVNMNTQAVLASGNVASVNFSSGDFTVNWSTAITGSYGVLVTHDQGNGTPRNAGVQVAPPSSTNVRIAAYQNGGGANFNYVTVAAIQ